MRALISVSDKTGIVNFAQALHKLGYEIISTGGTFKVLQENSIPVIAIDEVTGFPEMLDGRVKTLHPKIHGGLLARRDIPEHMAKCQQYQIGLIDLVVVNLYPFEKTIAKLDVTIEEAVENIDIGGPSMLRSASKNYQSVGVVVNPNRYASVLMELGANNGQLSLSLKAELAQEAFAHTARYDALIAGFFKERIMATSAQNALFQDNIAPVLSKVTDLRYGENPHQAAAFYKIDGMSGLADLRQLAGKELSYNNLLDIEAAWQIVSEFELPAATVIKHTNPCGAALGDNIAAAYRKAYAADPVSAYGSIVGLNRPLDLETAQEIAKTFVEVVVAPAFDAPALALLSQKSALRLVQLPRRQTEKIQFRYVAGGFLAQTPDNLVADQAKLVIPTQHKPTSKQLNDLIFGYGLVKHVKSNAIVLVLDGQLLGTGAGQMSRVDAVEIALRKAGARAKDAVLASDAFFPFKDGVELAIKAGVKALIQPGGSKRDQEVIACCDEHQVAMVFTQVRHFKH